jgi:hypothetical protein
MAVVISDSLMLAMLSEDIYGRDGVDIEVHVARNAIGDA